MKTKYLSTLLTLCVFSWAALAVWAAEKMDRNNDLAAAPTAIEWQPHTGEAIDGSPLRGEIGRILVPENRDGAAGKSFEIAFVRFRTEHPNPGPPIFFLAGGPGGSGIEGAALVGSHPQIRLLEQRDVIGIDQRGTGLSIPDLTEDAIDHQLPWDQPVSAEKLRAATGHAAELTVSHWRAEGVDLEAFNTRENAADIDAVREALGLEKIALWGTSYGSHLGLAYLRRFGNHVERAVIAKVEGPNHTFKLPSTIQKHLEAVHDMASDDAAARQTTPDILGTVSRLLGQLEERPVTVELEGEHAGRSLVVGPLDLQIALSRALASSQTVAEIPRLLRAFSDGDWSELAEASIDHRQAAIYAMALMMDCSSGATPERWRRLREEAADPANLLSDAINAPFYPEACEGAGGPDLGDAFRSAFESEVPVLFLSGTLDARTPPENVEELLPGFPNAIHIVAENAGHESRELMSPEFRDLLQSYWRGEKLESLKITLPEPIFTVEDPDDVEEEAGRESESESAAASG